MKKREKVENLTQKKLSEFEVTDTLYIRKLENDFPIIYFCSFECIKRGIVHAKIISAEPDWSRPEVGKIITARPYNCFLWGCVPNQLHPSCFWFSDIRTKVRGL